MNIQDLLKTNAVLLADGATGTNLFDMGLMSGDAPELWNIDEPEKIRGLHRGFIEAGSDLILTNSFGGNRHRLKLHNAQDRVFELNKAAAELARQEADDASRPVIVAGSVGPTGELFVPLGDLTFDAAVESFTEQAEGLKAGGADVLWIETMSSQEEIEAAATAAKAVGMDYVFTASFDTAGRTMMGITPETFTTIGPTEPQKPIAIGANCGVGASDLMVTISKMRAVDQDQLIVAKANCGVPVVSGDHVHYSGTPELMADYARLAMDAGAQIIGGCCGTTFEHVAAMRAAIDAHVAANAPTEEDIIARLGPLASPPPDENTTSRRREGGRRRRG